MAIKYHDNMHGIMYGADGTLTNNWDAARDYCAELCRVYFRIDCPAYHYCNGFSSDVAREEFFTEARAVLSAFDVSEDCGFDPAGKPYLYIHPQNISGVVLKNAVKPISEAFNACSSLSIRWVDIYEDVFIMDAAEYRAYLLEWESAICADILHIFETKRKNLYIPCESMHDAACQKILSKYHLHRLCRNGDNSAMDGILGDLFFELLEKLCSAGEIATATTKSGKAYRTIKKERN